MLTRFHTAKGFTLVELLIVVVVLGILAGVVLPAFNTSTDDAKASSAQQSLQAMRSAIDLYKVQHNETFPGYPVGGGTPTSSLFADQLTLNSKKDGTTAALGTAAHPFGPYLRSGLPANPYNNLATVTIIADATAFPSSPDDTTGWIYKPKTGELKLNSSATTSEGKAVFSF